MFVIFRVQTAGMHPAAYGREAFWDFPSESKSRADASVESRLTLEKQRLPDVAYARITAGELHGADMDAKHMSVNMLKSVLYIYRYIILYIYIYMIYIYIYICY
jgi:hypothetical protein